MVPCLINEAQGLYVVLRGTSAEKEGRKWHSVALPHVSNGNLLNQVTEGTPTVLQQVGMSRQAGGMIIQMQAEMLISVSHGLHFPCTCARGVA
jgi:hypothetical protein